MAQNTPVSRHFHRPDGRDDFERARRAHAAALLDQGLDAGAARLLELGAVLDAGVARCKRDLLASSLCWNEENESTIAWICRQHRGVADMGSRLSQEMRDEPRADGTLGESVAALTLHHWAEAVKWSPTRERLDYAPVQEILRHAIARGRQGAAIHWVADGRGRATTLEALYFRALLLDRFATGSLTRTQLELLDAWLWEWSGALHGATQMPEGAALRVDLDQNTGLREGARAGSGESLYLALAPLERRRREVISALHQGRVVPQHGCASDFRVEEHVALLDHLQRAFRADSVERAPRRHVAGTRVEVWVGLAEILSRGVGIGSQTGRYQALNVAAGSFDEAARARFSESTRRYLWLADASDTGLGFQAMGTDARGLEIGELLGWRWNPGGPLFLGSVVRMLAGADGASMTIGVRVLTEAAKPMPLKQAVDFDNGGGADGTFLFVPGSDASGSNDTFLLPESALELRTTFRTHAGGNQYALRFNRVRARGRGWIAAGFEVLPARREAPQAVEQVDRPLPVLELSHLEDASFEDAWNRDLSARMRT